MCAWRYSAGASNTAGGASSASPFGTAAAGLSHFSTGLSGAGSAAGAYLRQSAAGLGTADGMGISASGAFGASALLGAGGGGAGLALASASGYSTTGGAAANRHASVGQQRSTMHSEDDEEYEEEEEGHGEQHSVDNYRGTPSANVPPVSLPAKSLAAALTRSTPAAAGLSLRDPRGGAAAAAVNAQRSAQLAAGLSRQLFKTQMNGPTRAAVDEEEMAEEGFDLLPLADQEFVRNTRDLFDDVDPELLAEDFVPHEHVVGIIADDASGNEATASQIEDNLGDYKSLADEIDATLDDYIEGHHEEFNDAICDFSEMVLAVSGSDDTLAQFKKELADAVGSLESHAAELKVLRLRAAKSLFMAEALGHIKDVIQAETEVKSLLQGRHYLRAVQQLQNQAKLLASDELKGVRAIQTLRDAHNATVASLHLPIIDELLSCVFRQERLLVADAQLLQDMLDSGEKILKDANASAPNVQHTVYKYWKIAGVDEGYGDEDGGAINVAEAKKGVRKDASGPDTNRDRSGAGGHSGGGEPGNDGGGGGAPQRKERTLAAIIETLYDDPNDTNVAGNYLRFVPLCVKSLLLLGKIDCCHETFFSRATRNIERFIAHFLRLYDAWRRRSRSGATLSGDEEAAIRGTYVRALDLANDLISFDEAVATIQARDLRAMLGALFTELEKILRNAEYLQKTVLVAHFPFISDCIVQPVPFSAEATSRQWNLMDVPLRDEVWLRDTLSTVLDYAQNRLSEAPPSPSSSSAAGAAEESLASSSQLQSGRRSNGGGALAINPDAGDVVAKFLEFFSVDALLAPLTDSAKGTEGSSVAAAQAPARPLAPVGSTSVASSTAAPPASPLLPALNARNRFLTLQVICSAVDAACSSVSAKYPSTSELLLSKLALVFTAELRDALRVKLVAEVQAMQQTWDLQVLWAQLNYHIELVFHVLCDAKEAQEEADDAVTLLPFLRQKNLISRVQRTALMMHDAERQSDDATTLDRLLSTFESSGLLRMMEETGTVSFSLVGAVKKAQADIRKANEGQQRQYEAMQSDTAKWVALTDSRPGGGGGASSSGPSLMQLRASMLRRWFVFTAMNAVTCYECAARFYSRSCDRVPEFRLLSEEDCVVGFFKRFLRATYIPTLHAFHSQQLQVLCMSIGDNGAGDAAPIGGSAAGVGGTATTSTDPTVADRDSKSASSAPLPPGSPGVGTASKAAASLNSLSGAWPTVVVDGVPFPILGCVQYVGQVLAKISDVRRVLPESLTDEVEQNTSEALIMELVVFLKRQVQWLGRGTLAHRLLDQPFEDAFAGLPNRKWAALVDEENIDQAHRFIDEDLHRYYQLSSEQRTSGHEYNDTTAVSELQAMMALEVGPAASGGASRAPVQDGGGSDLDPQIGRMEPRDICMRDDSTLVAFALLCTSAEWLCDALLRYLWPGQRRARNYTDCCVPGYTFSHEMRVGDATNFSIADGDYTAQHRVRLSGHLARLCSVAQVSLFHLSVEARFLAFLFLPQLRDVSYDVVAVSSAADSFVQAYARRVHNFYAILRQHLNSKKIKYTCLTAGRPASELVLCELAHLRYKAISSAGLMRLRTDLLVMQTTLQLVLPADSDVRETVSHDFVRPALFLRYVFNKDVVNEIVSSLDYQNFSSKEVEVLIRLVFRQVSGANDDTLATQQIKFFYQKLRTIEKLRSERGVASANASTNVSAPISPGDATRKVYPAPLPGAESSKRGITSGREGVLRLAPPPVASVNAAAVVAAALTEGSDGDEFSEGEAHASGRDDLADAPPPLPLLSSARSRQKTAVTPVPTSAASLPVTPSKSTPSPPPPAATGGTGTRGAPAPAPLSEEEEEETEEREEEEEEEEEEAEEEEEETPERPVGITTRPAPAGVRPAPSAAAPTPLRAGTASAATATAGRHVDPMARPSLPPRPVLPPLATSALGAVSAVRPTVSAPVKGGAHVESSEDDDEEYEYEEETEETEETEEEEEHNPAPAVPAGAPRRAPAPRLPAPRQPPSSETK
ncbi:hypothetical protein ABL78_6343 [Leptomonas seymouri]|uniref:Exocyst complex component Sec8 n=1 Tax=Leptomonas seymouri TaxID=5684 RepID=A0A0N1IIB9_LEPSE|nr:hypothetical protein ABL78_6343 [Leptomonas seymouri]|eukprot:KPI84611.1 hypothetical protein ABL78_6343 [Leptomonas seymouri]